MTTLREDLDSIRAGSKLAALMPVLRAAVEIAGDVASVEPFVAPEIGAVQHHLEQAAEAAARAVDALVARHEAAR